MSAPDAAETLIEKIRDGSAPANIRAAAARGALPFSRDVLARLFALLIDDAEESIRTDARASLEAFDKEAVVQILSDPACGAEVLRYYAPLATHDEALAAEISFHVNSPNDALEILGSRGNSAVLELVLTNQERLLRSTGLLDRISMNPALRPDQRGRILELLERASNLQTEMTEEGGEEPDDEPMDAEEAARLLEVDVGELYAASEILGGEEFEQSEDIELRNAYKKILTLNTGQRAILAMKGGREERLILVRDSNKLVSLSVLKNGRITDGEVEYIAAMRNVSQDVLRTIGTNREWVKSYTVMKALIHNPRTPPGVATNFVSRLHDRDLKMLGRDKNVPELIRRMAKRTSDARNQRKKSGFRR